MKRIIILLILFTYFFVINNSLHAQKHYATGDRINSRINNRLISKKSAPGQQLFQPSYQAVDNLNIIIDGKKDEEVWKDAQEISGK